mgnify:CR=1
MKMKELTLLDYFAAKAMQALIQARATLDEDHPLSFHDAVTNGVCADIPDHYDDGEPLTFADDVSADAYLIAGSMILRRSKWEEHINKVARDEEGNE